MDAEKAVALANQYGIATVLCIMMVGVLIWVLKWVFDTSKSREDALAKIINTSITGVSANISSLSENIHSNTMMIQEVGRNLKDGFDSMREMAKYQREEHEKILKAVSESECKAK